MQSTSALIGKITRHWGEDNYPSRKGPFSSRNFSLPAITTNLNPTAVIAGGQYAFKMTATGTNTSDCPIVWSYNIPGAFRDKIFGSPNGDLLFKVPVNSSGTWTLPITATNCQGSDTENFVLTISIGQIVPVALGVSSAIGPVYLPADITALTQFQRSSLNGSYDIISNYSGGYLLLAFPHSINPASIKVSQGGVPIKIHKVQGQLTVNTVSVDIYRSEFPLNQISYQERTNNPIVVKYTI